MAGHPPGRQRRAGAQPADVAPRLRRCTAAQRTGGTDAAGPRLPPPANYGAAGGRQERAWPCGDVRRRGPRAAAALPGRARSGRGRRWATLPLPVRPEPGARIETGRLGQGGRADCRRSWPDASIHHSHATPPPPHGPGARWAGPPCDRAVRRPPLAGDDQAVHPPEWPRNRRTCAGAPPRPGSTTRAAPGRSAVMTQPRALVSDAPTSRWSPLDLARYDRSPHLTAPERAALARLSTASPQRNGQRLDDGRAPLQRLLEPVADALALFGIPAGL